MHPALFPTATLAEFYRFAVLLAGNAKAAQRAMAGTLAEAEAQCGQMRSDKSRQAWFVADLRARCERASADEPAGPRLMRAEADGELLDIEAFLVAQRFHGLPEPERSALALFYLDSFSIEEIAQLLKTDTRQLAALLGRARGQLEAALAP